MIWPLGPPQQHSVSQHVRSPLEIKGQQAFGLAQSEPSRESSKPNTANEAKSAQVTSSQPHSCSPRSSDSAPQTSPSPAIRCTTRIPADHAMSIVGPLPPCAVAAWKRRIQGESK